MLQELSKKFAEQAAERPLCVVLETGDQTVDGKAVSPGRGDPLEGGRLFQALAARQARGGQGQGAGLAVIAQPGQLGFTGHADRRDVVCGFCAEQTELFVFNQM